MFFFRIESQGYYATNTQYRPEIPKEESPQTADADETETTQSRPPAGKSSNESCCFVISPVDLMQDFSVCQMKLYL